MRKALFLTEQEAVKIVTTDGRDFIYICLNGIDMTDEQNGGNYFEYDYNEIICPSGTLDLEDVKKNPGDYLEYVYKEPAELSIEEQLNDVQLALTEIYEFMLGDE